MLPSASPRSLRYTDNGYFSSSSPCEQTTAITYYTGGTPTSGSTSGGTALTEAQMNAIRSSMTTLSSSSLLFAGSCDDDSAEPSHEVTAIAADGSRYQLTNGYSGNNDWYTVTYQTTSDLEAKFLLPAAFEQDDRYDEATGGGAYSGGCINGGGSLVGWTGQYIYVK